MTLWFWNWEGKLLAKIDKIRLVNFPAVPAMADMVTASSQGPNYEGIASAQPGKLLLALHHSEWQVYSNIHEKSNSEWFGGISCNSINSFPEVAAVCVHKTQLLGK